MMTTISMLMLYLPLSVDKCGESTNSLGLKAEDKTRVPAHIVI